MTPPPCLLQEEADEDKVNINVSVIDQNWQNASVTLKEMCRAY